jgi:hypothetical protein
MADDEGDNELLNIHNIFHNHDSLKHKNIIDKFDN